ncbi:MAG: hypothetical protein KJT03_06145 [Verrucomicrobiae bacterium]|nr:hypothetical protein [Verrucomicrobiae bacterium]
MPRDASIKQIQEACKTIALQMMRIQPAIAGLEDEETQKDVIKATYQLTIELETIKKKLIKLQNRDNSAEL